MSSPPLDPTSPVPSSHNHKRDSAAVIAPCEVSHTISLVQLTSRLSQAFIEMAKHKAIFNSKGLRALDATQTPQHPAFHGIANSIHGLLTPQPSPLSQCFDANPTKASPDLFLFLYQPSPSNIAPSGAVLRRWKTEACKQEHPGGSTSTSRRGTSGCAPSIPHTVWHTCP